MPPGTATARRCRASDSTVSMLAPSICTANAMQLRPVRPLIKDSTGAADAVRAADMGAGEPQFAAQEIRQAANVPQPGARSRRPFTDIRTRISSSLTAASVRRRRLAAARAHQTRQHGAAVIGAGVNVAFGLDAVEAELLRSIAHGVVIRARAAKGLLDAFQANGGGAYADADNTSPLSTSAILASSRKTATPASARSWCRLVASVKALKLRMQATTGKRISRSISSVRRSVERSPRKKFSAGMLRTPSGPCAINSASRTTATAGNSAFDRHEPACRRWCRGCGSSAIPDRPWFSKSAGSRTSPDRNTRPCFVSSSARSQAARPPPQVIEAGTAVEIDQRFRPDRAGSSSVAAGFGRRTSSALHLDSLPSGRRLLQVNLARCI